MSDCTSSAIPERWSKADTHCVVCQRQLATKHEEHRHYGFECEPPVCWCVDFCWVEQGGDCIGDPMVDTADDLGLWMRVRTAEEQVDRLSFVMACADTPLMRDVMAERDAHATTIQILAGFIDLDSLDADDRAFVERLTAPHSGSSGAQS